MGRDCASESVPIALAEGRPEDDLRAKASAEIDVAAVTVEGSPQTGPERPRAPSGGCELPSALRRGDGGDEGVQGLRPPAKIGRVILATPAAAAE